MDIRIATDADMAKVFGLRFLVFVDEQGVPREIELDSEDAHAVHIIAEDGGEAVGCARVIASGTDAHIGRLAVKREYRGRGIGRAVFRLAVDISLGRGASLIWFHAQLHAVGFYEKLGFHRVGDVFLEAGIEHVRMERVCR